MGGKFSKRNKKETRDVGYVPPQKYIHPLYKINPDTVPFIHHKGEIIEARIVDVYDGDTITVLYMYQNIPMKKKIRVLGIDTPEKIVRGKKKGTYLGNLEEAAGNHVKNKVEVLLNEKIIPLEIQKNDKYGGRLNGVVYFPPGSEWETLTDYLLANKYGRPYSGDEKKDWTEEELIYILNN